VFAAAHNRMFEPLSAAQEPEMAIYISVDRRTYDGTLQISIGQQDDDGGGHGYRIAGPKYDGSGKTLLRHVITARDKEQIISYLRQVKD
jgi:hypothetical protein